MKSKRQEKILELIAEYEIETQEELIFYLNKFGFEATQATISRDIRDLRLFKVSGVHKKYRYAYINETEGEITAKMKSLFRDCVISVNYAQNLVVIKTLTGNGANAGAVVDKLNYEEIVGSVAGDDTLLVVCCDNQAADRVVEKINEFLK
mgnify:CR=1 FL=1